MYSRNTNRPAESQDYPFILPERYGGSRFRPRREPETRVHTETAVPLTPSPIHLSPAAPLRVAEEPAAVSRGEIEDTLSLPPEEEPASGEAPPEDVPAGDVAQEKEASTPSGGLLAGLTGEDLLLCGLILLLSREDTDSDLPALLALLLAYRPSSDGNR